MGDNLSSGRIAVLSSAWGRHEETAFVIRSLAAAASRSGPVDVLVPGPTGLAHPDGAFDLMGVGEPSPGSPWPALDLASWPPRHTPSLVLADEAGPDLIALLGHLAPGVPVAVIATGALGVEGVDAVLSVGAGAGVSGTGRNGDSSGRVGYDSGRAGDSPGQGGRSSGRTGDSSGRVGGAEPALDSDRTSAVHQVGLHVPVNPLAAAHRHNGLGFTGYVLVLSDRGPDEADAKTPTPLASWIVARFPRRHVVVVEQAVASIWRSRSLRGRVTVDTRTDLWRLVAHAQVVVDLRPGPLVARECVESMRYGIPVVVPAGTVASDLAALGGGLWYHGVAELLGCVDAFGDSDLRDTLGEQGREVADKLYGDPGRFVERVRAVTRAIAAARTGATDRAAPADPAAPVNPVNRSAPVAPVNPVAPE